MTDRRPGTESSPGRSATAESALEPDIERALDRYPEIRELGLVVYTPGGFGLFLTSAQPRFDGRSALDLLAAGQSALVYGALAADHEGLDY